MFKLVLYKEKVRPQSEITSHQKKNLNLLKKKQVENWHFFKNLKKNSQNGNKQGYFCR